MGAAAAVVISILPPQAANASPTLDRELRADRGLRWRPRALAFPVRRTQLSPVAPYLLAADSRSSAAQKTAETIQETRAPVVVTPTQGAAFLLAPLATVRVRSSGRPRFERIIGSSAQTRGRVIEAGTRVEAGVWRLSQPPGAAGVWLILADEPTALTVEYPSPARPRLVWRDTRRALLGWIDGGPAPELPIAAGTTMLQLQLDAEEELGARLIGADARLEPAVRAWRKASALTSLALVRPRRSPYYRRGELKLTSPHGAVEVDGARYSQLRDARTERVTLAGPGVVSIEVRALLARIDDNAEVTLELRTGTRLVAARRARLGALQRATRGPSAAFPDRQPIAVNETFASRRLMLEAPLLPGTHRYTITARTTNAGQSLIISARVAHRRAPLGNALSGHVADVGSYLRLARRHVQGRDGEASMRLRALLSLLNGDAASISGTSAEAHLARLVARPPTRGSAEAAAKAGLARRQNDAATWWLRLQLARALETRGEWVLATRVARVQKQLPNRPAILSLLARYLGTDPSEESPMAPTAAGLAIVTPELATGAAELAWRGAPADPDIRVRYAEVWRGARWAREFPTPPWNATEATRPVPPAPPAGTWLERRPAAVGQEGAASQMMRGTLWSVANCGAREIDLAPSIIDGERPALLRLYVEAPANARGPITVRVGTTQFRGLPLRDHETWELAVPPGRHRLRVEAPHGVQVFSSAPFRRDETRTRPPPSKEKPVTTARLRRFWPLSSSGSSVHYRLRAADSPAPIRVELRQLNPAAAAPAVVVLHTDGGATRMLRIDNARADLSMAPLQTLRYATKLPPPLSDPVNATLWLPAGTRAVWLSGPDSIVAAIYTRTTRADTQAVAAKPPAPTVRRPIPRMREQIPAKTPENRFAAIAALSHALLSHPADALLLAQRGHLLLDVGALGWARHDLYRAQRRSPRAAPTTRTTALIRDLASRTASWFEPSHLPKQPRILTHAEVVRPALLAMKASSKQLRLWTAAARERAPAPSLEQDSSEAADCLRAALLARNGNRRSAGDAFARAFLRHRTKAQDAVMQLGLAALDQWELELATGTSALAPVAYGIADRIRALIAERTARRVRRLAATSSRWRGVRGAESNAGYERLYAPLDSGSTEAAQIRDALLSAPWSAANAHRLTAGGVATMSLTLKSPTNVSPHLWCRRLRTSPRERAPHCRFSIVVDRAPAVAVDVPLAQDTALPVLRLAAGPHRIEIELDTADDTVVAAVKYSTSRTISGAKPRRPVRALTATKDTALRLTVLGPTTMRVRTWGVGLAAVPFQVEVAEAREGNDPWSVSAVIQQRTSNRSASEIGDRERALPLTEPVDTIVVLSKPIAYRLTVRPRSTGTIASRIWRREARKAPAAPSMAWQRVVRRDDEPGTWPLLADGLTILDAPRVARGRETSLATVSIGTTVGRDSLDTIDTENGATLTRGELRADWRRQLAARRLWFRGGARLRFLRAAASTSGLRAALEVRQLPGQLRVSASARGQTALVGGSREYSARGRLRVSRNQRVNPNVDVIAGLAFTQRYFSLSATDAAGDPNIDSLLFTSYGANHQRALAPSLSARWRPWQDALISGGLRIITNEGLGSLDQLGAHLALRGVAMVPSIGSPAYVLRYRPSLRFADADRSARFFRHDLRAGVRWSLWSQGRSRLRVELQSEVALSTIARRTAVSFGLTYFWTAGRGLTDMMPAEEEFDELIAAEPWHDPHP